MILGLDVSTSTIGYSVLDSEGKMQELGFLSLKKANNLLEKADIYEALLTELKSKYSFSRVIIEEAFQRYSRGMSSARTITLLAAFNGIIQYVNYKLLRITPELISVSAARKLCGIKVLSKKKAGKEVKEQVFEWVDNHLGYEWPTKILRNGPRKGIEIMLPETRDMADAWVVSFAGYVQSTQAN